MNQSGELLNTVLSNGHTADIQMVEQLVKALQAKLYADNEVTGSNRIQVKLMY